MQHLDEGTIHAWLDGALPTTEAREVEQHVADCAECAATVAEARGLVAGASRIVSSLDVVRGNVIPKKPAGGAGKSLWHSLRLTPARAALAATLMIAVSTLLTVRHDTDEKLVLPAPAASSPAAASETTPPAADAKSPAPAPPPVARQSAAGSAPSKPKAADREKERAEPASKPKEELKANVVTDATAAAPPVVPAPVSAAGAATANLLDTSFKKTLVKAAEIDSVRRGQEQFRRAPAFAAARSSNMALTTTCFQFVEPQASGVPQRFALQALAQDTSQRVVRAIDENGRIDTVITGSNWTRLTPTEVTVRFASNDQPVIVAVRGPAFGVTSAVDERRDVAKRTRLSVSPLTCRP
jgi:hypothetical protein